MREKGQTFVLLGERHDQGDHCHYLSLHCEPQLPFFFPFSFIHWAFGNCIGLLLKFYPIFLWPLTWFSLEPFLSLSEGGTDFLTGSHFCPRSKSFLIFKSHLMAPSKTRRVSKHDPSAMRDKGRVTNYHSYPSNPLIGYLTGGGG